MPSVKGTSRSSRIASLIEQLKEEEEEAREIRRKSADWNFIEKLPPKQRLALEYYIEKGDIWVASRIAGLSVDEFDELRKRAKVPHVV